MRRIRRAGRIALPLSAAESETKRKLAGAEVRREGGAVDAALPHRRQGRRQVALGKAPPVGMGDERMMEVGRFWQSKQDLEQPLDRGRGSQVFTTHDQSDF